jgi:hypothetical protein
MPARSCLRAGVLILGVADLTIGVWAYLLPHAFYNGVPTVAMMPPFNQHFVTDAGAFFVAQGVLMVAAAIIMEYRLVMVALTSYLTFAVLHMVFHTTHLQGMPAGDAIGLVIGLAFDVLIPVALLTVARCLAKGADAEAFSGLPE